MKLPEKEKAAHKAAFRAMSPTEKLDHIWTYYKWPILLGLIALGILFSAVHRRLTQKEPVVYLALANVTVADELEGALTEGFLRSIGAETRRQEVYLYKDLYLSDNADTLNHQFAYASGMKLMGAVQAQNLDLVLTNREGYDLLSSKGYLRELEGMLSGAAAERLVSNTVILEDNGLEVALNEAQEHTVTTQTAKNALDVTDAAVFSRAGFPDRVYLGILANTPRAEACLQYITYLLTGE